MSAAAQAAKLCSLAVWSLVLGVLSLCCGLFTGIPAVICGHLALPRIERSEGAMEGSGLAIAGLVTGYIGTVLGTIATFAVLAGMLLPAAVAGRQRAREVRSMNNLRQIVSAFHTYAMRHDGQAPDGLQELVDLQLLSAEALVSPFAEDESPAVGYRLVFRGNISTAQAPHRVVLVEEIAATPGGRRCVGYLDGHVEQTRE